MNDFMSVLEHIGKGSTEDDEGDEEMRDAEGIKDDGGTDSDDELCEKDEKEITEIAEDFVVMKNKDVLKRNLMILVRENFQLKKRVKRLESRVKCSAGGKRLNMTFQIDTEGKEDAICPEDNEHTISYNSAATTSNDILGCVIPESPVPETSSSSRNKCWNCEGDHTLAECKEPKDQRKISKNRKEFQAANAQSQTSRYHEESDQKFGHLAPGLPSKALLAALGVQPSHLPPYIYRLRELGYPPGWLKHASIKESGLSLYKDCLTSPCTAPLSADADTQRYDVEKLVSWPGFNSPLPKDMVDETFKYRALPIHKCKSLRDMKRELAGREQRGYKKGKIQDSQEADDSIVDLTDSQEEGEDMAPPGEEGEIVEEEEKELVRTPIKPKMGTGELAQVEAVEGTPIVEQYSPFNQLPAYSKFGVNMTEHIVFDNLPNYTGTWDKMTGIIQKIRERKEEEKED